MQNRCFSWEDALKRLKEGNDLYLTSAISKGDISLDRRISVFENGQKPNAVVISCSDSRVIPESIFSANIGDLFVIRTVGNVVDSTVLASMEYAVTHLNVPIVIVLGHTGCGAINAAINGNAKGLIAKSIDKICAVIGDEKDDYMASRINVCAGVKSVQELLSNECPNCKVFGAMYFGDSGKVKFLE